MLDAPFVYDPGYGQPLWTPKNYGGDMLVRNVEVAAKLVNSINKLGVSMGVTFGAARDMFAWVGPVVTALHGNAVCDVDPSCSQTRIHHSGSQNRPVGGKLGQAQGQLTQIQFFRIVQAAVGKGSFQPVDEGCLIHGEDLHDLR